LVLVAPSDNVDTATGSDFYYIEVPHSGHYNIIDFQEPGAGGPRRNAFLLAMRGGRKELAAKGAPYLMVQEIINDDQDDFDVTLSGAGARGEQTISVDQVLFVIHGIRDYGYWTRKLSARTRQLAEKRGNRWRSVTSKYAFFPMGPFLLAAERRKRIEWLMDQYVMARALYPQASFAYIGHSNGTYLLAGALRACPAVKETLKNRAVLGGCLG
jgi:hypothetical protein